MRNRGFRHVAVGVVSGCLVLLLTSLCYAYGNHQPLAILNIKPAGTGNPALSANARIFRAYPGLEYNIRAAVVGGQYPYAFRLNNAPAGMSVDEWGVISWPDPQKSASDIVLTATDQDGDSVSARWSITVTAEGFLFVDAARGGGAGENGSREHPFDALHDILDLNGHESDIVYFRAGTYIVPLFHPYSVKNQGCSLGYDGGRPRQWLSYLGETVTVNMGGHCLESGGSAVTEFYFDGLTFINSINHTLRINSGINNVTIRRCDFNGLTQNRGNYNGNQGFYYTPRQGISHNLVIQDSKFHDYTDTAGIGSLYYQHDFLIEDNDFYDQKRKGNMICVAIAPKSHVQNCTIRHNRITISAGGALGHAVNSAFTGPSWDYSMDSRNIEICYNLFRCSDGATAHTFNTHDLMFDTWFYRNTTIGNFQFKFLDAQYQDRPEDNGPFHLENNVIINSVADYTYHYTCGDNPGSNIALDRANIKGRPGDGIVDADGNLTGKYLAQVGTVGHKLAESPVPPGDTEVPAIAITSPVSSSSFTAEMANISLSGFASDNVGVTRVAWMNDQGGHGSASGLTDWRIDALSLSEGVNRITVTAYDAAGNSASDILSVTYSPPAGTRTVVLGDCSDSGFPGTLKDSYLNTTAGNYSTHAKLNTYTWPVDTAANAILLKADLSSVPHGARIISAELGLYLLESGGDAVYTLPVHRIINHDPLIELASGESFDGTNPWTAPLVQSDIAQAVDVVNADHTTGYKTWDMTEIVKIWMDGTADNYGMLINSDTGASSDSYRYFAASEHPVAAQRPRLTITYLVDSEPDTQSPAAPVGLKVTTVLE